MTKVPVMPLIGYFKDVKDHWIGRNKDYPLINVIIITILTIMTFAEGWDDIKIVYFFSQPRPETIFRRCPFSLVNRELAPLSSEYGLPRRCVPDKNRLCTGKLGMLQENRSYSNPFRQAVLRQYEKQSETDGSVQ